MCHCSVVLGVHSWLSGEISGNLDMSYFFKCVCVKCDSLPHPAQSNGMFHCGTCSVWRWQLVAEVCLVFLLSLRRWSGDATATFLPRRAFGLGEGLLVCMLLGMHLVVQEVTGQFVTVVNLQLGNRSDTVRTDWRIYTSYKLFLVNKVQPSDVLHNYFKVDRTMTTC